MARHRSHRREHGVRPERAFCAEAAPDTDAGRFAAWFTAQWADLSPSTWNVSLNAIRSAAAG